jgi:hypothetical protein
MQTNALTRNIDWTASEKKVARVAFDAALARELAAIRRQVEEILSGSPDPAQVWEVFKYLSKKQRDIDWKYDYRYSVLVDVFGQLLGEGWLTEAELTKLSAEKLDLIKRVAAAIKRRDA